MDLRHVDTPSALWHDTKAQKAKEEKMETTHFDNSSSQSSPSPLGRGPGVRTILPLAILYLGCGQSTDTGSSSSSYVQHLRQRTDAQGEAYFAERDVRAVVKDKSGNLLPNIMVHYAFKDDKNVVLAVDPSGNHVPERAVFSGTRLRRGGERRYAASVGEFIEFVLENPNAVGEIVDQVSMPHAGDLLGEEEDVNRYCMTLDQITHTTIDVPAGLVLLAPQAAGLDTTLVRRAATALLGEIAERHIVSRYGEQAGYEVWVPQTAMSVCGEEYNEAVCDISGGQLEQIWDPELPYWRINGSCEPSSEKQGCSGEVLFEDEFDGTELDLEKWETNAEGREDKFFLPSNGILEIHVPGGDAIMNSRSTYTIGDSTLCFEARWKVGEREGTEALFGLNDIARGIGVGFLLYTSDGLVCDNTSSDSCSESTTSCNLEVTKYHSFEFRQNKGNVEYYVDDNLTASSKRCIPNEHLNVEASCSSRDGREKTCYLDYIKISAE